MNDLISRQAAIDEGMSYINGDCFCDKEDFAKYIEFIEQLPSIQPKRGRWIEADVCGNTTSWECSCCHNWTGLPTGWNVKAKLWFCPKCTADMRGEQDG